MGFDKIYLRSSKQEIKNRFLNNRHSVILPQEGQNLLYPQNQNSNISNSNEQNEKDILPVPDLILKQTEEYLNYLRDIFELVLTNSTSLKNKIFRTYDRISSNINLLGQKFKMYHSKSILYMDTNLSYYFKQLSVLSERVNKLKARPKPVDLYELRKNYLRLNGIVEKFMEVGSEYGSQKKELFENQDDEPTSTEVLSSIYTLIQSDQAAKETMSRQDFEVNTFDFWSKVLRMKGINIQNCSARSILNLFNIKGPNSFITAHTQTDNSIIDTRMIELQNEYVEIREQNKILQQEKYEDLENIP